MGYDRQSVRRGVEFMIVEIRCPGLHGEVDTEGRDMRRTKVLDSQVVESDKPGECLSRKVNQKRVGLLSPAGTRLVTTAGTADYSCLLSEQGTALVPQGKSPGAIRHKVGTRSNPICSRFLGGVPPSQRAKRDARRR